MLREALPEDRSRMLFPGYVFLHAEPLLDWDLLLKTPCVTGIVRSGERPIPARDGRFEKLQALMLAGDGSIWRDSTGEWRPGPVPKVVDAPRYARGQRLRIPSWEAFGEYVGDKGASVQLWVDMFGKRHLKTLLAALVVPA
jgi:transcription antitermination factor NusG